MQRWCETRSLKLHATRMILSTPPSSFDRSTGIPSLVLATGLSGNCVHVPESRLLLCPQEWAPPKQKSKVKTRSKGGLRRRGRRRLTWTEPALRQSLLRASLEGRSPTYEALSGPHCDCPLLVRTASKHAEVVTAGCSPRWVPESPVATIIPPVPLNFLLDFLLGGLTERHVELLAARTCRQCLSDLAALIALPYVLWKWFSGRAHPRP